MHLSAIFGLKILKKGVQIEPKLARRPGTQKGLSALLECRLAQMLGLARELMDWDKAYFFGFL